MGVCKYLLTGNEVAIGQLPVFQVLVQNEYRGGRTDVSYTSYVECVYDGYIVRLGNGQILTVCVLYCKLMSDGNFMSLLCTYRLGLRASTLRLVQWLKLPAWDVGDSGLVPRSGIPNKRFLPAHS